jgi:hypothetical protein
VNWLVVIIFCLYCPKGKLVEGSKRTEQILAALLHSRCPTLLAQESRLSFTHHLQDLWEWAMLESNQRPLPCEGEASSSPAFIEGHKPA